jgi:dethiobiotin synthase
LGKIVFITGTDTGAGKTVLTSLLLAHLRSTGIRALGLKPFCSGTRADASLLFDLNDREIPLAWVNPFYFRKPLAPLVAARLTARRVSLDETVRKIRELQEKCDILLVEGVGGVLVPLGEGFVVLDLIAHLRCPVLLASRNGIGVLNHVLLSASAIAARGRIKMDVVLSANANPDISTKTNPALLREFLPESKVVELPFLKGNLGSATTIRRQAEVHRALLRKLVLH